MYSLFNSISQQPDIDEIYLYTRDPYEAKYQIVINKQENTSLKYFNDSKAFIECSNEMDDIYKNIEEHNPNKKRKTSTFFADMFDNKKLNTIVISYLSQVES